MTAAQSSTLSLPSLSNLHQAHAPSPFNLCGTQISADSTALKIQLLGLMLHDQQHRETLLCARRDTFVKIHESAKTSNGNRICIDKDDAPGYFSHTLFKEAKEIADTETILVAQRKSLMLKAEELYSSMVIPAPAQSAHTG